MKETTHKHRNIIDDILDLTLIICSIAYIIWGDKINIEFTGTEWAEIVALAAVGRATLRRVLTRLFRVEPYEPDSTGGASSNEDKPSDTSAEDALKDDGEPSKESDDGEDTPDEDKTPDKAAFGPPPKTGDSD